MCEQKGRFGGMNTTQVKDTIKKMLDKMTAADFENIALDNGGEIVIRTELYMWDCGLYHAYPQETKEDHISNTEDRFLRAERLGRFGVFSRR